MKRTLFADVLALLLVTAPALSQEMSYPHAKVSFDDFKGLVSQVEAHRAERLVDFDTFLAMSMEPGTIITVIETYTSSTNSWT